jgi:hypothetical protein
LPSFNKDPKKSFNLEYSGHQQLKETLLENAPNDEDIQYQRVFQDHIVIELHKVSFFFSENYKYNLNRFEKIKVGLSFN